MPPKELAGRLSSSSAVKSLSSEQTVANVLRHLGWRVIHGSFYLDPITQKYRELDVAANRIWTYKNRGKEQFSRLSLKCEIKSIRDYHLIFSPRMDYALPDLCEYEWIGHHDKRYSAILEKSGMSPDQIRKALNQFEHMTVTPTGLLRPYKMMIEPQSAKHCSSAFRETNIGSEKELDASVLWRAIQCVTTSVQSGKMKYLNQSFEQILFELELAKRINEDPLHYTKESLELECNRISLYHPIVVIESKMWSLQSNLLVPIDWCRFYQIGVGDFDVWCDIVTLSYVKKYFRELTQHYDRAMKKIGARRIR